MRPSKEDGIDLTTFFALATLFCTILSQTVSSQKSEVISEILCWIILQILVNKVRWTYTKIKYEEVKHTENDPSSLSLWVIAVCIAVSSLFKAEEGTAELFPILTPALLFVQMQIHSKGSTSTIPGTASFDFLVSCTSLVSLFTTIAPLNGDFRGPALSIIAIVAKSLIFVAFLPRDKAKWRFVPYIESIEDTISALSTRVIAMLFAALCVEIIVAGFTLDHVTRVALLGLSKAFGWYFLIRTARVTTWCIGPAIETFSILCSQSPFMESSEIQSIVHVIASVLALTQTKQMLPKQSKQRSYLMMLALIPVIAYLANISAIRKAHSTAQGSFNDKTTHPVQILADRAHHQFESILLKQSKNYTTAHGEYRRRYGIEPPNGFDAWYEFAEQHESPIIDEFNTMHDTIAPFLQMSGKDVLEMMESAQAASGSELWECVYSRNTSELHCHHPDRTYDRHIKSSFSKMLQMPGIVLPDLKFLVNHLDEPRVLLAPEGKQRSLGISEFNVTKMSHEPTWGTITKYCSFGRYRRDSETINHAETFGIPFVDNKVAARDLCAHEEFESMHGLLIQPTSFSLVEGRIPILSTGSLSTMGDILYPSPAYSEVEFEYNPESDVEWEDKHSNLYWAGSTTGGFASSDRWQEFHRQRFVSLAQNVGPQSHYYLRESNGLVDCVQSTFLNTRLFDVAFTKLFQCERKYCRDEKAYFKFKGRADKNRVLQSRLAFDTDGNGISGRYYQLLASKSVPLKQTLFREWHDDRLVPWVHYIPVSMGMQELPELVSHLTSNKKGQQTAKDIADQGRDWFSKAFREVDQHIYNYRLLLELARLQDPERLASPNIVGSV